MLEFQNVSYQYPSEDFDIIDHLSFAVEPGSFHCICLLYTSPSPRD